MKKNTTFFYKKLFSFKKMLKTFNIIKNKKKIKIIFFILFCIFLLGCKNEFVKKGKKSIKNLTKKKILTNTKSFLIQIKKIQKESPKLYEKNKLIYSKIKKWIKNSSNINQLNKFGINLLKMKGIDDYGHVKITGYYTPVVEARKIKKNKFKYPIYSVPFNLKNKKFLPKRKEIYNGILDKKYILSYSNSLLNNFFMEIQGSAFINYGHNTPLVFYSYSGKNNWPYTSIGKILINRGDIKEKNMSMETIKIWCMKHTEKEVKNLFEENESFVFFKETKRKQVYGASSVPLIPKTSIAADKSVIKNGSVALLKIPKLNKNGIFSGHYEMRMVVALDVGGAIKGQHIDLYEGIGKNAGISAGLYNHYGYAWILSEKI